MAAAKYVNNPEWRQELVSDLWELESHPEEPFHFYGTVILTATHVCDKIRHNISVSLPPGFPFEPPRIHFQDLDCHHNKEYSCLQDHYFSFGNHWNPVACDVSAIMFTVIEQLNGIRAATPQGKTVPPVPPKRPKQPPASSVPTDLSQIESIGVIFDEQKLFDQWFRNPEWLQGLHSDRWDLYRDHVNPYKFSGVVTLDNTKRNIQLLFTTEFPIVPPGVWLLDSDNVNDDRWLIDISFTFTDWNWRPESCTLYGIMTMLINDHVDNEMK